MGTPNSLDIFHAMMLLYLMQCGLARVTLCCCCWFPPAQPAGHLETESSEQAIQSVRLKPNSCAEQLTCS